MENYLVRLILSVIGYFVRKNLVEYQENTANSKTISQARNVSFPCVKLTGY